MSGSNDIGDVLRRLETTIASRKGASADSSYTASLLAGGAQKCAKKFGEEAVEAALAAVSGDKSHLTAEAADVLYHLIVMLAQQDVSLNDVADALAAREGRSGHDEKASRKT
ncbi:phosphoribosyl-ATP diphosphatase [Marinicaulis aureus]|uniref:Phosphoribosyl-ATP pyrophosphatase n=1 Tax=Hyphococcus aureus TaxID=2666033 RepID=A0ABW1KW58_9PROT